MLRNSFFFSSLIGAGSSAVGGSIARTQDLEPMHDHPVAAGAGGLKEARVLAEAEGLKHVDLNVVNEIAVPDRLEQAVGGTDGEDVLRRLLLPRK